MSRSRARSSALALALILSVAGPAVAQPPSSLLGCDGRAWRALSEGEKLSVLTGFLIGSALEQGLAVSKDAAMEPASFLETLRRERRLRFPFAPSVYKARLEDFYYYQDRLEVPLYRALFLINEHILEGGAAGR